MWSAVQEPGHTSASAAPWRIRRHKPDGEVLGEQDGAEPVRGGVWFEGGRDAGVAEDGLAWEKGRGPADDRVNRGMAQRRAHGADGADDGLQLDGPGLGAAEDAVVAGEHVGLGRHQDEVEVEGRQARPQRGELHVQAHHDGDPQALPRDDVDRGPGGQEPAGRVLLAGGEAQLVLREDAAVREEQPRAVEVSGRSTLLAGRGEGHGARQQGDAVAGRQRAQAASASPVSEASQGTCWFTGRPGGAKLSHWAQANSGSTSSRAPAACASAIRASTLATQAASAVAGGSRLIAQSAAVRVSIVRLLDVIRSPRGPSGANLPHDRNLWVRVADRNPWDE